MKRKKKESGPLNLVEQTGVPASDPKPAIKNDNMSNQHVTDSVGKTLEDFFNELAKEARGNDK
jgi:hypothetical protein